MSDDGRAEYLTVRDQYAQGEGLAYRELDKWLITIAGATLGAAGAFLKDLVPLNQASHKWFAGIGALLVCIALCTCLLSLLLSCSAFRSYVRALDHEAKRGTSDNFFDRVRAKQEDVASVHLIRAMNWVGVLAYIFGAVSLIVFIVINATKGTPQ